MYNTDINIWICPELRPCIYEKMGGEFDFPTVPDFDEFIGEPCDPNEVVDDAYPYTGDCARRRLLVWNISLNIPVSLNWVYTESGLIERKIDNC